MYHEEALIEGFIRASFQYTDIWAQEYKRRGQSGHQKVHNIFVVHPITRVWTRSLLARDAARNSQDEKFERVGCGKDGDSRIRTTPFADRPVMNYFFSQLQASPLEALSKG